jgi:hypothetical protein
VTVLQLVHLRGCRFPVDVRLNGLPLSATCWENPLRTGDVVEWRGVDCDGWATWEGQNPQLHGNAGGERP